jgi:crossover junction endodeoxyribonuclease RuvC
MLICGIDPGQNGAIAFMLDGVLVNVEDLPLVDVEHGKGTKKELSPALLHDRLLDAERRIDLAVLESVNSFGMGRQSAFRFGENVGMIKGVLAASGIRTQMVTPQKWKRAMGIGADKNLSRAAAIRLWPMKSEWFRRIKDDGRAESALLCEWAQRFA